MNCVGRHTADLVRYARSTWRIPLRRAKRATARLLLCASCSVLGAEPNSRFAVDVFGTAQGLPSSEVLAVTQTRDGYLWAGTLAGLARFDGVQFAVFDENNTPGLNSSQIRRLYEDRQTNLWVGTENGDIAIIQSGAVTNLDLGQSGASGRLMAICEDTNGAVLLYTYNGLLARYRDGRVDARPVGSGMTSNCRALIADDSGSILAGTDTQLLALKPSSLEPEKVSAIRLNFLLASTRGGYWLLANNRIQKCKGDHVERDWGVYPWTNTFPIVAACEDRDGNLVVGTYGDGVYWFDAEGKATRISIEEGLSHPYILALTVDREGCLWVGTNGGGMCRVRRKLFDVLERSRGLVVQTVCEDGQGGLWIGYTANKVDHYTSSSAQRFRLIPGSIPVDVNPDTLLDVKSVFVGRRQGVLGGNWVLGGTWGARGPHLYQLEYGQFAPLALPPGLDWQVSAIFQDRAGRLWLGAQGGLLRLDDLKLFTSRDGLSANDVRAITEDREGNLWIGTEGGGLDRFRDGRFDYYTKTNGLPGNRVSAMEVDADGVLWVATSGGLARFQGGRWTHYTKKEGLASNSLGYLLEDGRGFLWLGSTAGLMRLSKLELNRFAEDSSAPLACRVYGETDGLPATECTTGSQPGPLRSTDGTLWFPTIQGLAWLKPAQLNLNTSPPPVVIEAVLVDGQVQTAETLRASPPQAVTVPAGKEGLEIRFASLNLAAPDKGRFRVPFARVPFAKLPGELERALRHGPRGSLWQAAAGPLSFPSHRLQ